MAKEFATYLKGQRGRVGNVVFRKFRSGYVTSSRPEFIKRTPTPAEAARRERFAVLSKLTAAFAKAAKLGFYPNTLGMMGARNQFSKRNARYVRLTNDNVVEVDYSHIDLTSADKLAAPAFQSPTTSEDLTITVAYSSASDVNETSQNDIIRLVAVNPDLMMGVVSAGTPRSAGTVSVKVPSLWSGMEVHVYAFAIGMEDGVNKDWRSATNYLGKVTVE